MGKGEKSILAPLFKLSTKISKITLEKKRYWGDLKTAAVVG